MRSLEQLINTQLERWAIERRAQEERDRESSTPPEHHPWIAIARDYGSGGSNIARSLSHRLGYHLFDHEILDGVARESRLRRELLESVDEKARSSVETHVDALLHGESFAKSDYLKYLIRVVATIGEHGCAVILGRGANYILEPEAGLSVRIISPQASRVETVAQRSSLPEAEARRRVREADKARAAFRKTHFHRDPWRAEDYDLILNTGRIEEETAIDLIVQALRAKFPREASLLAS